MTKSVVLTVSIILLLNGFASAAPVEMEELQGTSWVLYSKAKLSSDIAEAKYFTDKVYAIFHQGNTFFFEDGENYTFSGTYSNSKPVFTMNPDGIEEYLENYAERALDEAGYGESIDYQWIEIAKLTTTGRFSKSRSRLSLTATISVKAKVNVVNIYGQTSDFNISYKIKIYGDHPAKNSQDWVSKWAVSANAKVKIENIETAVPVNLNLELGDLSTSWYPMNQYNLFDPNNVIFFTDMTSYFCRTKSKLLFPGDYSGIDLNIGQMILENTEEFSDVFNIEVSDFILTATIRDNKSIRLKGTIYFNATMELKSGGDRQIEGTIKLTGKGVPAP